MTTQTILSDAELIVKGYNAVIADTQYEFEDVKAEVLLQLEDLDEDFDTYREFELRLEAYENGAFDPDIEKILGIGGRKAGTWNPRSEKAKENRARGRLKSKGSTGTEDTARIQDADAATRYRQAGKIHPSQFKGARPGGKPKGAGGGYKGGENISDRDSFAGAIARKLVGGKRGAAKKKEEATQAVKDKASQGRQALTDTASKATAGAQTAGSALASGGRNVSGAVAGGGRAVVGGGKKVGRTAANVGTGVSNIATDLGSATASSYRGENKGVRSSHSTRGAGQRGGADYRPPGSRTPAPTINKPSSHSGGYLQAEFIKAAQSNWARKSFTNRLRKSMGYRVRER
jgi:hypothetical protein